MRRQQGWAHDPLRHGLKICGHKATFTSDDASNFFFFQYYFVASTPCKYCAKCLTVLYNYRSYDLVLPAVTKATWHHIQIAMNCG